MNKRTPLYDCHLAVGAKMVDFAGWDMPLHYGSQLQEHHLVRQNIGMFDVSHMTIIDLDGSDVVKFLQYVLANNVDRLAQGKALYSCLLTEQGGVIDDLIVYKIHDTFFRLIVNSATRDKDLTWLENQAHSYQLSIKERTDLAMLAVQGPKARDKLSQIFSSYAQNIADLKPFHAFFAGTFFIARTGYTGEDGFEIIFPAQEAADFWHQLLSAGIKPCGLGARDTLRLEAGLNLYGIDMDETVTPFESNLTWTVAFEPKERHFIGREALEKQLQQGVTKKLVGLVLEGQGVLRNHQKIQVVGKGVGEITSGSFSPTLGKGIALARVPSEATNECLVDMRGKWVLARIVKLPFVRQGKKAFSEISQNGAVV